MKLSTSKWRGNHERGRVTALTTKFMVFGRSTRSTCFVVSEGGISGEFPANLGEHPNLTCWLKQLRLATYKAGREAEKGGFNRPDRMGRIRICSCRQFNRLERNMKKGGF